MRKKCDTPCARWCANHSGRPRHSLRVMTMITRASILVLIKTFLQTAQSPDCQVHAHANPAEWCVRSSQKTREDKRRAMFSRGFDGNKCKVQLKMLINRCLFRRPHVQPLACLSFIHHHHCAQVQPAHIKEGQPGEAAETAGTGAEPRGPEAEGRRGCVLWVAHPTSSAVSGGHAPAG